MRGVLWVPSDAKTRFPAPPEGSCGRQDARKSVSRGIGGVGTKGRETSVRHATRGVLWAPTLPIATSRFRGPSRVGVERRIAPWRGMGRVGRVVGQRTVHSAHLPPVELPCPQRAENREGRPRRRRAQTGFGSRRPARSRRPAAPAANSVPLFTYHARSAGESQTPICARQRTMSPGPRDGFPGSTAPESLPTRDCGTTSPRNASGHKSLDSLGFCQIGRAGSNRAGRGTLAVAAQAPLQVGNQKGVRNLCYALVTSQLVIDEASAGDPGAAAERLKLLEGLAIVPLDDDVRTLARAMVSASIMPPRAAADALHIAAAAVAGVQYLLTLNCRHIANAHELPRVYRLLDEHGFGQLLICTPAEFLGGDDADDEESHSR